MHKEITISNNTIIDIPLKHGLISGSSESGKTTTIKLLAEQFSQNNIPVFLVDIKGDLSGLSDPNEMTLDIKNQLETLNIDNYNFRAFNCEFWDIFETSGLSIRTTVTKMGPLILSKILNLNDVQSSIIDIVFKIADGEELLLIDLKDLRLLLNYISENSKEFRLKYGTISNQSIGAILRAILKLEDEFSNLFGEIDLQVEDLVNSKHNEGVINILDAQKLIYHPQLFSSFLLWILSEIYENLPEVDNNETKFVFFFENAELLFKDSSQHLIRKIEEVISLAHTKGIAIFFTTNNPLDIPQNISKLLQNKIYHQQDSYTNKDKTIIKDIVNNLKETNNLDLTLELANLKVTEAIISLVNKDNTLDDTQKIVLLPPQSSLNNLDKIKRVNIYKSSLLYNKYSVYIDRESAYEILSKRQIEAIKQAKLDEEIKMRKRSKRESERDRRKNPLYKIYRTTINTFTGDIGRKIARGALGTITKSLKNN